MQQLFLPGEVVRIVKCDSEPNLVGVESRVVSVITSYEANIERIEAILKRELTHKEKEVVKKETPFSYFCVLETVCFLSAIINPDDEIDKREYIYTYNIIQSSLRRVEPISSLTYGGIIQALRKGKLAPLPF